MFSYFYMILPAMILAIYAQSKVSSTYQKYARVRNQGGYTGAEVARMLLQNAGIYDVTVEKVRGNLTDHYDPRSKVLRLSEGVYDSASVAALGIAAHETGHAVQDDRGYFFLRLRGALVPLSNIGSNLAMPLIILGILFGAASQFGYTLVQLGIILFSLAVLFTIITLPVEFNASHRAIAMLEDQGYLTTEEIVPAKKVLSAAALTYVAATLVAVLNLLRLVMIFGRRND